MDAAVLKKLHENMLEIYEEIARVCDAHGLTYFVVGGTLLGAVVHKGYIPWDDDLDLAMPREDYDQFVNCYADELSPRFYMHSQNSDKRYWVPFSKVRIANSIFLEEKRKNVDSASGIYVDVFPFDYAPSKSCGFVASAKWRLINYLNNYIYSTVTGMRVSSASSSVLNPIFSLFSINALSRYRDAICKSFDKGDRRYFLDTGGGRSLDNSYFKVDDMLPLNELPFEDTTVKAPKESDMYLRQLYTEKYKIIPPENERVTHNPLLIRFEDGAEYRYES